MAAPSKDVQDILTAALVTAPATVTAAGYTIGHGAMPPGAAGLERYICVYDTGGYDGDIRVNLDKPTVQVRVRGLARGYDEAEAQIQLCKRALIGYKRATVNGTYYLAIAAMGDVALLEYDAQERPIFVANYLLWRQPATAGNRV
jgi:hypothetical protein